MLFDFIFYFKTKFKVLSKRVKLVVQFGDLDQDKQDMNKVKPNKCRCSCC